MYPPTISETRSANDLFNSAYAMFCGVFFVVFFLIFFLKAYVVGTHLNCISKSMQFKWVGTHNICLYKEVDKKYSGCNLKTTELFNYALIGVCAVIRSNRVCALSGAMTGTF